MDVRLAGDGGDGVDAALAIHEQVGSKVIFVTGSREPSTMDRIEQDHPAGVLFKPIYGRQLQNAVNKALAA
jgi:DNA-binding NarL/FixJ family response regulator